MDSCRRPKGCWHTCMCGLPRCFSLFALVFWPTITLSTCIPLSPPAWSLMIWPKSKLTWQSDPHGFVLTSAWQRCLCARFVFYPRVIFNPAGSSTLEPQFTTEYHSNIPRSDSPCKSNWEFVLAEIADQGPLSFLFDTKSSCSLAIFFERTSIAHRWHPTEVLWMHSTWKSSTSEEDTTTLVPLKPSSGPGLGSHFSPEEIPEQTPLSCVHVNRDNSHLRVFSQDKMGPGLNLPVT